MQVTKDRIQWNMHFVYETCRIPFGWCFRSPGGISACRNLQVQVSISSEARDSGAQNLSLFSFSTQLRQLNAPIAGWWSTKDAENGMSIYFSVKSVQSHFKEHFADCAKSKCFVEVGDSNTKSIKNVANSVSRSCRIALPKESVFQSINETKRTKIIKKRKNKEPRYVH